MFSSYASDSENIQKVFLRRIVEHFPKISSVYKIDLKILFITVVDCKICLDAFLWIPVPKFVEAQAK